MTSLLPDIAYRPTPMGLLLNVLLMALLLAIVAVDIMSDRSTPPSGVEWVWYAAFALGTVIVGIRARLDTSVSTAACLLAVRILLGRF